MTTNPIKTTFKEKKVIYVYHHPKNKEHEGWLKIGDQTGYNSRRIKDQNEADNIEAETLYMVDAIDIKGNTFRDADVHTLIDATGLFEREQKKNSKSGRYSEWYKMTLEEAIRAIESRINLTGFNPDILKGDKNEIKPRDEQQKAIDQTYDYWKEKEINSDRKFLWNAKPRFGKTMTSYWFAEKIRAKKILIVTNRPAVSDSWYGDYKDHIQPKGVYRFGSTKNNRHVTEKGSLKGRALNANEIKDVIKNNESIIFFISLQDVKGKDKTNPEMFKQKNKWIFEESWELFIIDESHEAVETKKAQNLFRNLKTDFELHLSGTPFKELANRKFKVQQIFNWTYEDEQSAKENWDPLDGSNPYYELPRMNMFAYKLSKALNAQIGEGEYAFDLNELFKVKHGNFLYEDKVLKFLDNLFGINSINNQSKKPFPFADSEIRDELRHTFWLLPGVAAVKALKKLIQNQAREVPSRRIFADYEIIDAAAKGDDEHEGKTSLEKVKRVIGDGVGTKSITLSCGQLTTGVTIRPWTAVLMLYGAEGGRTSATKYLQSAFRAQNPWKYTDEQKDERIKENCYVFDFAPDRLLLIFQEYAKNIIGGGGGSETKVKTLLNLLTVVAEDDYGEMKELDANEVVTMPLKLMTEEIVDGRFITSNKLFKIGNIFHLPAGAREILNDMGTIKKGRVEHYKNKNKIEELKLEFDEDGNLIMNKSNLGSKKYEELIENNPDLPTDRQIILNDIPSSDIKNDLEKQVKNEQKELETEFHDHLRYFARAIPMILMAYGKVDTKLDNFEKYIDASTFQELVGITKEQFKELRDKYDLFNEDVFNASITEFLNRKAELADYFENDNGSDIFDYIPPQQTNQIYTPKTVIKMMVDNLEKEDPSIFKSKDNKFLDPYVKSGLFITEIVKRLYKNLEHKIPDKNQRIEHILTKQVFGFSPSKILNLISHETIFGFMHGKPEFKRVEYRVKNNFVWFENEEIIVSKNQNALSDKIKEKWGENMKFTAIVGNPPYQIETKDTSDNPIYHYFIDSSQKIANTVCMIHPARFLFNAGKTPKTWNSKMLNDDHLKVVTYEPNSIKMFPNTDIKGGITITMWDENNKYGKIGVFARFKELNSILQKVSDYVNFESIMQIIYTQNKFNLDILLNDYPNYKKIIGSNGREKRLTTPIFEQLDIFSVNKKSEDDIEILGLIKNKRTYRWINKKYIDLHNNLGKYKVVLPKSNGTGEFGEKLSTPLIINPCVGYSFSFIGIGAFESKQEASSALKYIKSKFLRTMLGVLKVTQDNLKDKWAKIPIQNFTISSDINWSESIMNIDKQLYKKYGLSKEEIEFIETRVKPME